MARGRLYAGTSGFAYKQWKPGFYPADLKSAGMLGYYASRLPSVEINNTFYRMPTAALLESWKAQTPERFVFTLKAPQRITHLKRLKDVSEDVAFFLRTAGALGGKLGCLLFQCPPSLRYKAELLDGFLAALPPQTPRLAMEFRHPSWNEPEVRERIGARGIALCSVDDEGTDAEIVRTAREFVYLRLRKPGYDPARLDSWAEKIAPVLDDGADAYVYLKHEDDPAGVSYALRLLELA
ncbi:MAG: DUF72 domain-containing protein [Candidatus Binatia bacterium]